MAGYVYLIGNRTYFWYKIGKSSTPDVRIKDIGVLLPFKIEVFAVWKTDNHTLLEASLHEKYAKFCVNGEWFKFAPRRIPQIIYRDLPFDMLALRLHTTRIFPSIVTDTKFENFSNLDRDCPEGFRVVVNVKKEHHAL